MYPPVHPNTYPSTHPLWLSADVGVSQYDDTILCTSRCQCCPIRLIMMTSSNGNIFRVTGHLCGEFTGDRWIPRTKASDAELWCFLWSWINGWISNRRWGWWLETPSCPLWRHCNDASHGLPSFLGRISILKIRRSDDHIAFIAGILTPKFITSFNQDWGRPQALICWAISSLGCLI